MPARGELIGSSPVRGGVFIALGSNLGDRAAHLAAALREMDASGDIEVLRCSRFHETAPVGGPAGQGPFLNAAAELHTSRSPRGLLERLLEIERQRGRERRERWGPRTLDLDLLLYRGERIDEPDLQVPHPRMWERPFVMEPLREICDEQTLAAARELGEHVTGD
ncbi:MAG: 2-amino-4-hydroxy-6-hydroxymethyldihydropteridine diphosphokinase [Phycisphaerae bacterium]